MSKQHFVRVVEVWVPDDAGERLELRSGAYGPLSAFASDSEERTFARGEGLPGLAWVAAMPIVMRDLSNAAFLRAGPAREAGLTSGMAMPIFQGACLRAVLVFLCGDHGEAEGAIEIWRDDGLSGQSLIDGYYGKLERFGRQSRNIKFPLGWGLPGMVWKTAAPQIVDVANTNAFLRSQAALEAGISIGLGIPLNSDHNVDDIGFVVTFLSVRSTPIARRFEIWSVSDDGKRLHFTSGVEDRRDGIAMPDPGRRIARGEGAVGMALMSGLPWLEPAAAADPAAGEADDDNVSLLAIPIYHLHELRSVVALWY